MGSKSPRTATQPGGRLRRWKPVAVLAGIAVLILWASTDGAFFVRAQDQANAKKKSGQLMTRPIPGAGRTVDVVSLAKIIDDEIAMRLKLEKIMPSPKCDDSEFLRRVYLDLAGIIPAVDRVKAFLDSKDPNKREKLIDALLENSRFGKQLSEIWMHEIISPTDPENRLLPVENLRKWLEDGFNKGKPWNKMVEELVTGSGTVDENPTTILFAANSGVDKITGQVCRLFLGVQLQCAQCHNHPFTSWKQEEYWGMAAFFANVKQNATPKKAAKNEVPVTISESAAAFPGGKGAKKKKKGDVLPEGYKVVPAKFLAGTQPKIDKKGPARPVLAKWLASPNNPYLARAMVNRLWAQYFGRGFVNPIDDMHDDNPATHPELLAALTEQFKRHNFDIKYLAKAIVLSDAYQRTSKPFQGNEADTELFSRMAIRMMSAEQMYDSITSMVGSPLPKKKGAPGGKKGGAFPGKKGGGTPRDQFVRFFRVEEGADPLDYQDGIPQVLRLINAPLLNKGGIPLEAAILKKTTAEGVKHLFLAVLSRPPSVEELQRFTTYISRQADQRTGYSDVLWTLLNTSEFRLNH